MEYDWDEFRNQAAVKVLTALVSNSEAQRQYRGDKDFQKIGNIQEVLALAAGMYADALVKVLREHPVV